MKCPYCNSNSVPTKHTQEFECGTIMRRCKYLRTMPCVDREAGRKDYISALETELRWAAKKIKAVTAYAAKLEAAGDPMAAWLSSERNLGNDHYQAMLWRQAKESKP